MQNNKKNKKQTIDINRDCEVGGVDEQESIYKESIENQSGKKIS